MKHLNQYILEKFKINKNTKTNSTLYDEILDFFMFSDGEDNDIAKSIKKWINNYNIENVIIVTTKEDLEGLNYFEDPNYLTFDKLIKSCEDNLYAKVDCNDQEVYDLCKKIIKNQKVDYQDKYGFTETYTSKSQYTYISNKNYIFIINLDYYKKYL